MFSQIKDRKNIEQNFYSVAGVRPQGWDQGVLGVKHFSVGIFASLTARSSLLCFVKKMLASRSDIRVSYILNLSKL